MPNKKSLSVPKHYIRADITSTADPQSRTVDVVFSTGYKGKRASYDGYFLEELSMNPEHIDTSRLMSGTMPLLDAHDAWSTKSVIGVVEKARIEDGKGIATVRFAKDAHSEEIFQKVQDGILRNISVGYKVHKYENNTPKGSQIPEYKAVRWEPLEISVVPIGFDPGARTRNESQEFFSAEIETRNEPILIEETNVLTGTDTRSIKENADMPTKQDTSSNASEQQTQTSSQPQQQPIPNLEDVKREAIETERKRVSEINGLVKRAKLEQSIADDFVQRGLSVDEARKEAFEKKCALDPQPARINHIEIGETEQEKKRGGIIDAILHRIDGVSFKLEDGNPFKYFSLLRMFEEYYGMKGFSPAAIVKRVMSSSDLPYILANAGEKAALAKYNIQPRTWSRWASTDKLRNYKTKSLVRSGDFASLLERKENAEFKRGSFSEEREQVSLKDWGIIMSFTRQMLINDDLSEITKVLSQAGVSASRLENRLVYECLTGNPTMGDGIALFHSSHANSGTAGALSDTTIGEAFKLMREQTTVDGLDKLNVAPRFLICGPQNEVLARKYLAVISPTQASNVNVFSSSLELIVDSEISNDDYFFAADQNVVPTVTLFHLEGQEQPRVETRIDFETESVEVKCAHSANAAVVDYRGLVRNTTS